MNYNKLFVAGDLYDVDGRVARYWGVENCDNNRRSLVFFERRTGKCITISTKYLDKIKKL